MDDSSLKDARQSLPQDGPCYTDCDDCQRVGGCLRKCCGWSGPSRLYVCVRPTGHTGNHRTVKL